MAQTYTSCVCDTDEVKCNKIACDNYASAGIFHDIPGDAVGPPSTFENGRCHAIYNNNGQFIEFQGLDPKEFEAQCRKACNTGSTC
ncbi:hypothetical protein CORC01_12594 [Colletotrichum orchidophilum]|uniref:Uncharacterized protein n=1 Tax=Colletotrichum orchidophilum TaxID=1209926 RepID=A0A1G4ASF0_9PEZI|nr:uncharacterized protein CORC01_12594 [Colletotrichum orchidophilum]OHE92079.1 hypothetical protein CORC01_12594 [Colletotrichum orchidophilum]